MKCIECKTQVVHYHSNQFCKECSKKFYEGENKMNSQILDEIKEDWEVERCIKPEYVDLLIENAVMADESTTSTKAP